MLKKWFILSVLFVLLVSLTGCASLHKQKELEMQGLKNQISVLEAQIQTKDAEIDSLKGALSREGEEKQAERLEASGKKKFTGEAKSRPNARQIQIALKNAGYNPGSIDGKLGRQTRDAIRAFQRANNLIVDGKAGRKTWGLLREYLDKKVK